MGQGQAKDRAAASESHGRRPKPPTVRQVYALASALCAAAGEPFPRTREEASALIERLRIEIGHPRPALEDHPLRGRMRPKFDWRAAAGKQAGPPAAGGPAP
jgi:hypothetical protein